MVYELHDTSFFIKCLKHPTASFNIMNYIKFSAGSTRSSSFHKLVHPSQSKSKHFYFNRLPRLWNSLPPIDLNQSHDTIMNSIKTLLGLPSWTILMTISHAHSISAAYATHVAVPPEWTSILTLKYVVDYRGGSTGMTGPDVIWRLARCCMIVFLLCLNFALPILRPCLSLPMLVPQGYSALFASILSGESKESITMMKARVQRWKSFRYDPH